MNMTLFDIASALGTSIDHDHDLVMERVCIDSRSVRTGDLFFCIIGNRLDGHEFARAAVASGATALVASRPLDVDVPVLLVRDTTLALGRLARIWRERTAARVIGVTGSAGKTTVKEMLSQVLSGMGTTGKNYRNLNNQIGLPMSMLEMSGDEAFWVFEMGISRPGDMDDLGHILAPDAALVVNIGPCHLEGLGSLQGVAEQKALLLDHVRPGGFACVNADYDLLLGAARTHQLRLALFSGQGGKAAYVCTGRTAKDDGYEYSMSTPAGTVSIATSANVHVPENVAAVTAMAMELGADAGTISRGLSAYAPVAQRFVQSRVGSWLFIDDTYNANPVSMARSIREAARIAGERRLVLVLADMRELGPDSAGAHRELGRIIAGTSAAQVFFAGAHAGDVCTGLDGFGGQFFAVDNADAVLKALEPYRRAEGVMLFKGSRGCKMENYYLHLERNWA